MSQKESKKNKKQKTSHKSSSTPRTVAESPISPIIYTDAEIERYASLHAKSLPYQHLVVENLCIDERMRVIHEEITTNMKANFKETDLFKVFQTGDLAALDDKLLAKMPNVLALRSAVYSAEFRDVVSRITGCTDLTDRVDFSANVYANSCHLMCHDDVIGTRRVSFVIYLTDPDDPWVVTDGGAFEMFPLEESSKVDRGPDFGGVQGIPESVPTACALPTYNTMMIFRVQPGRSYHAVQEVYSKHKPRLSISGWYHGPDPPKGADKASLQQIMTKGDDLRAFTPFVEAGASKDQTDVTSADKEDEEDEEVVLTKEDLAFLKQFINPQYLADSALEDINEQFCENSSLQLNDFLRQDLAVRIAKGMLKRDHAEGVGHGKPQLNYTLGTTSAAGEGWQLVGPPHKRRHLLYSASSAVAQGELSQLLPPQGKAGKTFDDEAHLDRLLDTVRQKLFRSPVFAKYLQKVTSLKVLGYKDELRRFRAGLDYTVAHYGVLTKIPRLDATLCFVNDSQEVEKSVLGASAPPLPRGAAGEDGEEQDEYDPEEEGDYYENLWESGDVGGFECYISADENAEDAEAAEVYRSADLSKNKNGEGEDGDNPEDSLLSVSASNNVLSLVMRDEGIMKFIKYVSCNAPGSRWDITSEYEIVVPESDSEDEDGSEGESEAEEE